MLVVIVGAGGGGVGIAVMHRRGRDHEKWKQPPDIQAHCGWGWVPALASPSACLPQSCHVPDICLGPVRTHPLYHLPLPFVATRRANVCKCEDCFGGFRCTSLPLTYQGYCSVSGALASPARPHRPGVRHTKQLPAPTVQTIPSANLRRPTEPCTGCCPESILSEALCIGKTATFGAKKSP